MKVEYYSETNIGKVRTNNEDAQEERNGTFRQNCWDGEKLRDVSIIEQTEMIG